MENLPTDFIENKIYEIRSLKVMLDSDLASLYEVETKSFKPNCKKKH